MWFQSDAINIMVADSNPCFTIWCLPNESEFDLNTDTCD